MARGGPSVYALRACKSPPLHRCLRFLARRAKDRKRGRDGTRYSRFHPANFLSHHLAKIVTAAVYSDAQHIEEGVIGLKQRAHELALAGASAA